jgi:hypothetical protein
MSVSLTPTSSSNHPECIGYGYGVTNSKKITSILWGTVHIIDAKSLQNISLRQLLECSELFTELGTHLPLPSNDGCFPGVEKHDIPYPHSVDGFVTIMAGWKKIPITSLDHQVPEMKVKLENADEKLKKIGAEAYGDSASEHWASSQLDHLDLAYKIVHAFRQGNLAEVEARRESSKAREPFIFEFETKKREEKWAGILIPKLLETDKPIGIAVGATHLVGEDGLAERFKRAGLKVERIYFTARSNL